MAEQKISRKQKILNAFSKIEADHGEITPTIIVKEAKKPSHPLHDEFDWNDQSAAHQARLDKARALLRIRVVVKTETISIRVPSYVRDPSKDGGDQGYISTVKLRDEKSLALDAVRAEFSRAIACMQRALDLADALDLSSEINELLSRARILQAKVA